MEDWRQMDSFIAATHGENHAIRNRPLFEWLFLRNGNRNVANLLVAYEDEKLISLLGYIPTTFRWGNEKVVGAWLAHWMTTTQHRFGIGVLLMKKIIEMFPVVAGQGASAMNQEIVAKMKFQFIEKIPKVVFIFKSAELSRTFGISLPPGNINAIDSCEQPNKVSRITKEIFNPDWTAYPSMKYGTLRDGAYLNSRFINFPFFRYHVFIEGPPIAPAICVVRIVDTKEGIRVARILEFFFPENESGRSDALLLIKKCLFFFKESDCDYSDFYCSSTGYIDFLNRSGFVEDEEGALPSLLDPIDRTRKFQNMELFVSADLKRRHPNCENEFIVTRADGDQDRPNESFGRAAK